MPGSPELDRFEEQLDQYEYLLWKEEQADQRKKLLENQLEKAKSAPRSRQFVDQFVGQREIESLQSQLHYAIDERKGLKKQKSEFLAALREKAPAYRESFERMRAGLVRSLERNNLAKDVAARIQTQLAELNHYIAMLDDLMSDSDDADDILIRPLGQVLLPGARGQNALAPPAPSHRFGVQGMVRRLEREQESLLKRWQQNEAALRKLRAGLKGPEPAREAQPAEAASSSNPDAPSPGAADDGRGPSIPAPLLRPEAFVAGIRTVGSNAPPSPPNTQ